MDCYTHFHSKVSIQCVSGLLFFFMISFLITIFKLLHKKYIKLIYQNDINDILLYNPSIPTINLLLGCLVKTPI